MSVKFELLNMAGVNRTRSLSNRRAPLKVIENNETEGLLSRRSRSKERSRPPSTDARINTPVNNGKTGFITKTEVKELLRDQNANMEAMLDKKLNVFMEMIVNKKIDLGANNLKSPGGRAAEESSEGGEGERMPSGVANNEGKYDELKEEVSKLKEAVEIMAAGLQDKKQKRENPDDQNENDNIGSEIVAPVQPPQTVAEQDMMERHLKTEQDVGELRNDITAIGIKLNELLEISRGNDRNWPALHQPPLQTNQQREREIGEEQYLAELKWKKRKNMIIFGLKEDLELTEERQNDLDEGHMDNILNILELRTRGFRFRVKRLGRWEDRENKIRPILVIFDSEFERDQVLGNARKLKNSVYKISLCKDLTKEERAQEKERYLNRKRRESQQRANSENPGNMAAPAGVLEQQQLRPQVTQDPNTVPQLPQT